MQALFFGAILIALNGFVGCVASSEDQEQNESTNPGATENTDPGTAGQSVPAAETSDSGGVDTGEVTDGTGVGPACELSSEPFGASEIWLVASGPATDLSDPTLFLGGVGTTLSNVELILDPFAGTVCSGFGPESIVTFDGATISIESTFVNDSLSGIFPSDDFADETDDPVEAETCSIRLTGTVEPCGTAIFVPFPSDVFDVQVSGTATISGAEHEVSIPLQLMRVRIPEPLACVEPPTSLVGTSWSISNVNYLDFSRVTFDGSDMVSVAVSGEGEALNSASVFVSVRPEAVDGAEDDFSPDLDCFASMPTGSVRFDGTTLELVVQLSAAPEDDAVVIDGEVFPINDTTGDFIHSTPTACTIRFSGTMTECGIYSSFPFLGFASPPTTFVRFDGDGSIEHADGAIALETLYLIPNGFGGSVVADDVSAVP